MSDVYPTVTAQAADLILPAAMWVEKEGAYGNARAAHPILAPAGRPPAKPTPTWQLVEFSKRFAVEEVWPAELLAEAPEHKGKPRLRGAVPQRPGRPPPADRGRGGFANWESEAFGFYLQKGLFEEYAEFGRHHGHDWRRSTPTTRRAACGGRWSTAGRPAGATARTDPYVEPGASVQFYGFPGKKARIFAFPYEPPAEPPDAEFDLWLVTGRVLEHWYSGSMTGRVRAVQGVPQRLVFTGRRRQAGLRRGDEVAVESRRSRSRPGSRHAAGTSRPWAWCSCPGSTPAS